MCLGRGDINSKRGLFFFFNFLVWFFDFLRLWMIYYIFYEVKGKEILSGEVWMRGFWGEFNLELVCEIYNIEGFNNRYELFNMS